MASPSSSSQQPAASRARGAFEILGIAPRFDLDPAELERAFFDHSKALHPDRFATAPAAERVVALTRSRELNDAYQTLKKPIPRAEYMLARAGVHIGDNERLDPAFLMEILELREELAEARVAGRSADVERLQGVMAARRTSAIAELAPLFAAGDFATVKERLILLRYINRYLEECDSALDES